MAWDSFSEALGSVLHGFHYDTPLLCIYFDYSSKVSRLNSVLAWVCMYMQNSWDLSDAEPACIRLKFGSQIFFQELNCWVFFGRVTETQKSLGKERYLQFIWPKLLLISGPYIRLCRYLLIRVSNISSKQDFTTSSCNTSHLVHLVQISPTPQTQMEVPWSCSCLLPLSCYHILMKRALPSYL